jgi:hypothetical protein
MYLKIVVESYEMFFFHTEGGVMYKALSEYGDQYIATGTFTPLIPQTSIYYLDGRYTDLMNKESIKGRIPLKKTKQYTKRQMNRFMREHKILLKNVTLYSFEEMFWFVKN